MKISIGYTSFADELNILGKYKNENPLTSISSVASIEDILILQNRVKNVQLVDKSI